MRPWRSFAARWRFLRAAERRFLMLDAMYLAIGCGFLIVAVLYVVACDRL
jgi:hypothetical protein